jgi:sigma-E factor negative regulatory protein RseC
LSTSQAIEHKGFIERINGNAVYVKILSQPACEMCHARGACPASDMQHKEVEVRNTRDHFRVGEVVDVVMSSSQAYSALLIAYILPFLFVFIILLSTTISGISELRAGLISLAVLPLYYLIIFLFRNKIRKKFTFSIRRSD